MKRVQINLLIQKAKKGKHVGPLVKMCFITTDLITEQSHFLKNLVVYCQRLRISKEKS